MKKTTLENNDDEMELKSRISLSYVFLKVIYGIYGCNYYGTF